MGNVMRQMEALARAQARAQIGRVLNSQVQRQLSTMLSHFNHTTVGDIHFPPPKSLYTLMMLQNA